MTNIRPFLFLLFLSLFTHCHAQGVEDVVFGKVTKEQVMASVVFKNPSVQGSVIRIDDVDNARVMLISDGVIHHIQDPWLYDTCTVDSDLMRLMVGYLEESGRSYSGAIRKRDHYRVTYRIDGTTGLFYVPDKGSALKFFSGLLSQIPSGDQGRKHLALRLTRMIRVVTPLQGYRGLIPYGFEFGRDSILESNTEYPDWVRDAQYPGGWNKFNQYLLKKLPVDYTGTFRFDITEQGYPSDVTCLDQDRESKLNWNRSDSILYGLIRGMPRCEPADIDGTKIPQGFELDFNPDVVFNVVDESAHPVDQISGFYRWVYENLKYPPAALKQKLTGRVFVQFIIEKDGTLSNPEILAGIGAGCNEEAIRLIAASPKWIPGTVNGKPARQRYTLPIIFKLNR